MKINNKRIDCTLKKLQEASFLELVLSRSRREGQGGSYKFNSGDFVSHEDKEEDIHPYMELEEEKGEEKEEDGVVNVYPSRGSDLGKRPLTDVVYSTEPATNKK